MTEVREIMSYGALTVQADERIRDVLGMVRRVGHEGFPVLKDDQIVGLLTSRDLNRAAENGLSHLHIRDVMMEGDVYISPHASISELLKLMVATDWGQIPIVEDHILVGIVTRTDVINYYANLETDLTTTRTITHSEVQAVLGAPIAGLIAHVARAAAEQGRTIYMVGGVVRDLLLQRHNDDVDFVLEGDAIEFAQALQAACGGEVEAHTPFGTAKWTFDREAAACIGEALEDLPPYIDLVSARHEFYQEPAILPTVYTSSIKLDLRRRDFTINALAVELSDEEASGNVVDLFGGLQDLKNGVIRVLHSLSFADDPTRALRAVRFAHRLNFQIEPRTASLITTALPMMSRITGERLRNELTLLLKEEAAPAALLQLQEMEALKAIHPRFVVDERIESFLAIAGTTPTPANISETEFRWLFVAAAMQPDDIEPVAGRLLFRKDTSHAMHATSLLVHQPEDYLQGEPADITFALEKLPLTAVMAASAVVDNEHRRKLKQYLQHWRHIEPITTGNTLKAMGLNPGPNFKTLLSKLRAARLNGTIQTEAEETAHLHKLIAESEN